MKTKIVYIIFLFYFCSNCKNHKKKSLKESNFETNKDQSIAAFTEGCFWCTEYIFESIPGIDSVVSGYAGGHKISPTHEEISEETTGHAEAMLIYYNNQKLKYEDLVNLFFISHDATTPNQQGPDKGETYRSIAFYQTVVQKNILKKRIAEIDSAKVLKNKIVTEIKPLVHFYIAESRHQNYVKRNPSDAYVKSVSIPRFNEFKKVYDGKLNY
jgi:peptide-methionine (S)-S-oxide reductase